MKLLTFWTEAKKFSRPDMKIINTFRKKTGSYDGFIHTLWHRFKHSHVTFKHTHLDTVSYSLWYGFTHCFNTIYGTVSHSSWYSFTNTFHTHTHTLHDTVLDSSWYGFILFIIRFYTHLSHTPWHSLILCMIQFHTIIRFRILHNTVS